MGNSSFPVMKSRETTAETMRRISNFTAKMDPSDPATVNALIEQLEPYIDLDLLLQAVRRTAAGGTSPIIGANANSSAVAQESADAAKVVGL